MAVSYLLLCTSLVMRAMSCTTDVHGGNFKYDRPWDWRENDDAIMPRFLMLPCCKNVNDNATVDDDDKHHCLLCCYIL